MIVLEQLSFATHSPAAGIEPAPVQELTVSGRRLDGQRTEWTITNHSLRSLSFLNRIIHVQRERIERFVIAYHVDDVYGLFVRGTFALPTRIWQPGQRPNGGRAEYDPQNMELGSVFGGIARNELVARLRQLGYEVVEQTWDELIQNQ